MDGSSEIRLVLIGKTGTGKSTLGNTILGKKAFFSTLSPVGITKQPKVERSERFGQTVDIIDTPGLTDPYFGKTESMREITNYCNQSPAATFIFLLVVAIGRMPMDDTTNIQSMKDVFGKNILDSTVVVFTHLDELESQGVSFDEYIKEASPSLQELLKECKHLSLNARSANNSQIRNLLDMVNQRVQNNRQRHPYTGKMLETACRKLSSSVSPWFQSIQRKLEIRMQNVKRYLDQTLDKLVLTYEELYNENNKLRRDFSIGHLQEKNNANCTRSRKRVLLERGQNGSTTPGHRGSDAINYVEVCQHKKTRQSRNSVTY